MGFDGDSLFAVLCAFFGQFAQHHIGVIHKVLIDGIAAVGFAKMTPIGFCFHGMVTLLQEQNIRNNARTGIGKKRIVRQTNRTEKVGTLCNVLAYRGVSFCPSFQMKVTNATIPPGRTLSKVFAKK